MPGPEIQDLVDYFHDERTLQSPRKVQYLRNIQRKFFSLWAGENRLARRGSPFKRGSLDPETSISIGTRRPTRML